MNNIKLKATQGEHGLSSIDLAEDSSTLGLFAIVFNDPDGSKGNRLVQCWNEHDELVGTLRSLIAIIIDDGGGYYVDYGDFLVVEKARALLAKIGGEK